MHLNIRFQHVLEQLMSQPNGLEQLKSILLWFSGDVDGVELSSDALQPVADGVQSMDSLTCLDYLNSLSMNDLAGLILMNEFGPSVQNKQGYAGLQDAVAVKLQNEVDAAGTLLQFSDTAQGNSGLKRLVGA